MGGRSIAQLFYERAREVYLADRPSLDLSIEQLVEMCGDVATQLELIRLVHGQNDPHFRELIVLFLEDAAAKLAEAGEKISDGADLLDRAGLAPTATVTAGAVAAIVATGGAAAPVLVLVAGAAALAGLGIGRTSLKAKARRRAADAEKIRGLAAKLRGDK